MSLNNFFKHKLLEEQKEAENQLKLKQAKIDQTRRIQSVQMKARADHRIEGFQETQLSKQYIDSMKKGTYPLLPVEKHSFRDRDKDKEMEKMGGIYLKTFHVAKERASLNQQDFQEGHLACDKFDPNLPHKNHQNWLRIDDPTKQSKSMRFGLGERTEVARVNNVVSKLSQQLDSGGKDLRMLHVPSWKEENKDKWIDTKTFNIYTIQYQGPRSNPPWRQHPVNLNNQNNQYIDGFEVTGDLSRPRQKEREGKRPDFVETVKEDQIGTTMHISRSLRTMKQDLVLNTQKNFDEYSNNKQLTFYKTSLIQSKSVDHTTPYQHSNNYKGLPIKSVRPQTNGKLYKLSINMTHKQIITKQPPNSADMKTAPRTELVVTPAEGLNKLTNIQEVSQYGGVQSQSNIPQSRESLNSRATQSRYMARPLKVAEGKLGYPYHQEDDATTKKIVGNYFEGQH